MNNKKMKKVIAILAIVIFSLNTNAQNATQAKALLNKVTAKVKTYNNIKIDFKYVLNNTKENIHQESKGNVEIESIQSNKYVLDFMGITKIFDGKKTYTIVPEDEEVSISKYDENDDNSLSPAKMLTFFNKGFNYAWDIPQNVKGRKIQYVKLIPISPKDQRKEILVGIDAQTKNIYNIIETGKNGTKTTLTVNSFKTNQPLSKNHFTFATSKYPGYYINSLD
jgi:outer membrane lipoprotein-sorting protein